LDLRGERDGVAVANVERAGSFGDGDHFISSREDRHPRFLVAPNRGGADLSGHRQFRETETEARRKREVACVGFAAARNDVLAGLRGAVDGDGLTGAVCELDHHDGVGIGRHSGPGHDLDARAGSQWLSDGIAGFDFADAAEGGSWACFARTDCVTIAGGTIERRIIAVSVYLLGQHKSKDGGDGECDRGTRGGVRLSFSDDELTGVSEREHCEIIVDVSGKDKSVFHAAADLALVKRPGPCTEPLWCF